MTQVIEILLHVREGPAYFTYSISWLLLSWRCKELGHQQTWYLLCWTRLIQSPPIKMLHIHCHFSLTPLHYFLKLYSYFLSNYVNYRWNIFVWSLSSVIGMCSALDTDGLVFSPRASLAIVMSMHPCISSCLWVNENIAAPSLFSLYGFMNLAAHFNNDFPL